MKKSLNEICDNFKQPNMPIVRVPKKEERQNDRKKSNI